MTYLLKILQEVPSTLRITLHSAPVACTMGSYLPSPSPPSNSTLATQAFLWLPQLLPSQRGLPRPCVKQLPTPLSSQHLLLFEITLFICLLVNYPLLNLSTPGRRRGLCICYSLPYPQYQGQHLQHCLCVP